MAINQCIYPYDPRVQSMPVYLTGIGGTEWQGAVTRPEGYFWHQILCTSGGRGCVKFGKTTINVSEGWYFILPAHCPHEYYPLEDRWEVRWLTFDGFACEQMMSDLGFGKALAAKLGECDTLHSLFNRMFTALKTDKVYGSCTCAGLMYEYLMELYRRYSDRSQTGGADHSSLLMPALNYIDDHFAEDFPMTELSAAAGVTPQHLCRIFRETMNMRPTEYLARRRLQTAKELLRGTEKPISDIAGCSGFSDPGYFSTVFRKYEGMTPADYRKCKGEKNL